MTKERFKLMPAACVILKKDNQILLHKRQNTGFQDGTYSIIGGGVDGNETVRQAAIREIKEEIGVNVKKEDLKIIHVLHTKSERPDDPSGECVVFFFETEKWDGEPKNMEPEKHECIKWFDVNNLPENLMPTGKQILDKVKEGDFYSEFGWD